MCFFFKQKPAYELRISDWSSVVCSSDLSFELGAKYGGFGNALNLSAAVYHSIYKDFQAGVLVPALVTTNIINAGKAKFTGVEVEGKIGRATCRERVCQYG